MKNIEKILKKCQICKKNLNKLFSLGKHPLCDDLIKINSKKKNITYPIDLLFCKVCFIVYQKYQIKEQILFPKKYHYRGRFTKDVVEGQEALVNSIIKKYGKLKNKKVLDIGCNDGTLLNFFYKEKAKTYGVEPTNAFKEANKKHEIINGFFNYNTAKLIKKKFKEIDYITFTNVFAHINNLDETLQSLKILISNNTKVIIENHYLGSVINKLQIDTFYHEHPRTYSFKSLLNICNKLNLNIEHFEFPKRYGGNIRVFMGNDVLVKNFNNILKKESNFFKHLKNIQKNIKNWKLKKKIQLKKLNSKFGPLPAKAFPGRAAILIKLLNLDKKNISSSYEKPNSKKIGYYIPGTKIPILNDKNLKKDINRKIPIINFAWHINNEINEYLKKKNIKNKIINILEKQDFK